MIKQFRQELVKSKLSDIQSNIRVGWFMRSSPKDDEPHPILNINLIDSNGCFINVEPRILEGLNLCMKI